jgi:hypothetical protein
MSDVWPIKSGNIPKLHFSIIALVKLQLFKWVLMKLTLLNKELSKFVLQAMEFYRMAFGIRTLLRSKLERQYPIEL